MSQSNLYPIQCPKCLTEQEVELYDAINVAASPELKTALLKNELNRINCSSCDFSFRIDKRLLYNDPDGKLLILLLPTTIDKLPEAEEEFQETVRTLYSLLPDEIKAPRLFLVLDHAELVERIFLHQKGIDTRVAEYIKFMIHSRNLDSIPPEKKRLLYNSEDSSDDSLSFVTQELESFLLENSVEFSKEAYMAVKETFEDDDNTGMIMEMFPGPYISARQMLLRGETAAIEPELD